MLVVGGGFVEVEVDDLVGGGDDSLAEGGVCGEEGGDFIFLEVGDGFLAEFGLFAAVE